jgi:penicillin amidase
LPVRPHTGIFPLLGWEPSQDWQGFHPPTELTTYSNPKEGFITTANNFIYTEGKPLPINLHMGSYRVERITELLKQKEKFTVDDMRTIHADVISVQARKFMEILKPNLPPNNPLSDMLSKWNYSYDLNSREAALFEEFYAALNEDVFGKVFKTKNAWERVRTFLGGIFFQQFDNIIFNYDPSLDSLLWKGETRDQLFARVIRKVFEGKKIQHLASYKESRTTVLIIAH